MKNTLSMCFFSQSLAVLLLGLVFIMQHAYTVDVKAPYDKEALDVLSNLPLGNTDNLIGNKNNILVNGKENKDKITRRIQMLKCVYGKIVQTAINEIIEVSTDNNKVKTLISKYRPYVSKILSTLMTVNVAAAYWLWNFHVVLITIENGNISAIKDFKNKSFVNQCNLFVDKCYTFNYLSRISLNNSSSQLAYDNMMTLLKDENKSVARKLNQYADKFGNTSNIMLVNLKDDLNFISVNHIIQENVWRPTAKRMEDMWAISMEKLIENKSNISQHHETIIATVNLSVAYAVWIHLRTVLHNKTTPSTYSSTPTYKDSVIRHFLNLLEVLRKAVADLYLQENTFYQNLLKMLAEKTSPNLSQLDGFVKGAKENLSKSLASVISLQHTSEITRLENNSSLVTKFTHNIEIPEEALKNIDQLRSFIASVTAKLTPFHWLFMKYYKQSLSDNWIDKFDTV